MKDLFVLADTKSRRGNTITEFDINDIVTLADEGSCTDSLEEARETKQKWEYNEDGESEYIIFRLSAEEIK